MIFREFVEGEEVESRFRMLRSGELDELYVVLGGGEGCGGEDCIALLVC